MSWLTRLIGRVEGAARSVRQARGEARDLAEFKALFADGHDTRAIAEITGFREHEVANALGRARDREKDPA